MFSPLSSQLSFLRDSPLESQFSHFVIVLVHDFIDFLVGLGEHQLVAGVAVVHRLALLVTQWQCGIGQGDVPGRLLLSVFDVRGDEIGRLWIGSS